MKYGKFLVWCDANNYFDRMFKGTIEYTTGSLWWKKMHTANIFSPIGYCWCVAETGYFLNLYDHTLDDRFKSYCVRNRLYTMEAKIEHFKTLREID